MLFSRNAPQVFVEASKSQSQSDTLTHGDSDGGWMLTIMAEIM
jgi:acyl-CoA hydrolase